MAEWTKSTFHKERYGDWAGNPSGHKPDFARCADEVWPNDRFPISHQCNRKRGFGPEQAFCKQHDPEAKKERERKACENYEKGIRRQKMMWGREFFDALRKIAEGHNDPRGLAQEVIAPFIKKPDEDTTP